MNHRNNANMANREWFDDKIILVTGAGGHIGSAIVSALAERRCRIVRVSRSGQLPKIAGRAEITDVAGNISASSVWKVGFKDGVHVVFHFAAQTSAFTAERRCISDVNDNVVPMLQLLTACGDLKKRPVVIFAGTVTQTGITRRTPVSERRADNPVTIYDLHKLHAESYLKYFSRQKVVEGVSLRLANVYGPGRAQSSADDRGFLNLMIRKALNLEVLTIYGKGENVRDFVYIDDVVGAFLAAARHAELLSGKHFVIGSGFGCSVAEAVLLVARLVKARLGKVSAIVHVPEPDHRLSIDRRMFVADTRSFRLGTGWRAKTALAAGIERTIDSYMRSS